jgi:hypothetical protein
MNPIRLNPSTVTRALVAAAIVLVIASMTGQVVVYWGGHDSVYGLVHLFYVDDEGNIPTYFSSTILLFSALLLAVIAALKKQSGDRHRRYWVALSLALFYMSMDEAAQIHELMSRPVKELLGHQTHGIFSIAWVIPGAAIMSLVALAFLRFVWQLPAKTRWMTFLAGALFVTGNIGFELIEGRYSEVHSVTNFPFSLLTTAEESLEMAGVIVWIHALLTYLAEQHPDVQFSFVSSAVESSRGKQHEVPVHH